MRSVLLLLMFLFVVLRQRDLYKRFCPASLLKSLRCLVGCSREVQSTEHAE